MDITRLETDSEDLYETAPCGFLSTLTDGTIVRVNKTLEGMTGFKRKQILNAKRFVDLLAAGSRIYHETHYSPLLQMQGHARELAMDLVCADGSVLPVLVFSVLRPAHGQSPDLIRVALLPATDRRNYEKELLRERRRAEDSETRAKSLAQSLQESLIPPAPPNIPGFEVAAAYRPAGVGDEVGGDFYDVFETAGDNWSVVIGDVAGKGVHAAAIATLARHTMRAASMNETKPKKVLQMLNQALLQHKVSRFCTVAHCRIHLDFQRGHTASIAIGGHPPPLLMRSGQAAEFVGEAGTLIGFFDQLTLSDTQISLSPSDVLFFYTDGVTEARRGDAFFGETRLKESLGALGEASAAQIAKHMVAQVVDFQDGLPRDDIAIVAVKVV